MNIALTHAPRFSTSFVLAGILIAGMIAPAIALSQGATQAPISAPTQAPASDKAAAPAIPEADRPTSEQLVQLFEVMRIRSQMETMLKAVPQAIQQQMKSEEQQITSSTPADAQPSPAQMEALNKVTAKFTEASMKLYPVNDMIADMVVIYQRHLSRQDVEAIAAFYKSPAGQDLLTQQPAMMKEIMPMTMQKMQERSKTLMTQYAKALKEAMDSAPAAAPAAKPAPAAPAAPTTNSAPSATPKQ